MKFSFLAKLEEQLATNKSAVLVTITEINFTGQEKQASAGGKIIISENKVYSTENVDEEVISALTDKIGDLSNITSPKLASYQLEKGEIEVFIEPIEDRPRLLIFGGGHVGQKLAEVASMVDFRVEVIDDRQEFANQDKFPTASQIYCQDFNSFLNGFKAQAGDYLVIVTRGHQHDYQVLKSVVSDDWSYLGMIGSKRKVELIFSELREENIANDRLKEIDAPIGLKINSETPAEIAVSITAALIAKRRGRDG